MVLHLVKRYRVNNIKKMPAFSYIAINELGVKRKGLSADSEEARKW